MVVYSLNKFVVLLISITNAVGEASSQFGTEIKAFCNDSVDTADNVALKDISFRNLKVTNTTEFFTISP